MTKLIPYDLMRRITPPDPHVELAYMDGLNGWWGFVLPIIYTAVIAIPPDRYEAMLASRLNVRLSNANRAVGEHIIHPLVGQPR